MNHQWDAKLLLEFIEKLRSEVETAFKEGGELWEMVARDEEPTPDKNYIVGRALELQNNLNRLLEGLHETAGRNGDLERITVIKVAYEKRMELRRIALGQNSSVKTENPPLLKAV